MSEATVEDAYYGDSKAKAAVAEAVEPTKAAIKEEFEAAQAAIKEKVEKFVLDDDISNQVTK